ncbi:4-hydroxy-tetrahydrodipicolinate reductase [Glaciihabitans sp. UYNi722]|uniref:4-hydroxy-tetrahydrodipicolinate reductase n=1 Tax=Glaciihabitans sp. UYNi722 TaxID=3156344 RepID=UPI0033981710
MTTTVAVVGATGKMGTLIGQLIDESADFEVVASIGSKGSLNEMLVADCVVDVTVPAVSQDVVDFAVDHGLSVLVGTSGWTSTRISSLERRVATKNTADGTSIGVIIIPNFSLGSVLATAFAAMAAKFFDSIEIVEAHSASKVDSPSGTATRTAELIGNARATLGPVEAPHTDQRARGQQVSSVPIHSLRMQGIVAKQDVIFGGTGEVLTLSHETIELTAYIAGIRLALAALRDTEGVVVGLDKLIDLGSADPSPQSPASIETT